MTAATEVKPLYQRLKDQGYGDALARDLTRSVLATLNIDNKRTAFDLHHALNEFVADLGVPEFSDEEEFWEDYKGEVGAPSDVPLYQRIDQEDPLIGETVRQMMRTFLGIVFSVDGQTYDELTHATDNFERALGLPTYDEASANPEAFPGVTPVPHPANAAADSA